MITKLRATFVDCLRQLLRPFVTQRLGRRIVFWDKVCAVVLYERSTLCCVLPVYLRQGASHFLLSNIWFLFTRGWRPSSWCWHCSPASDGKLIKSWTAWISSLLIRPYTENFILCLRINLRLLLKKTIAGISLKCDHILIPMSSSGVISVWLSLQAGGWGCKQLIKQDLCVSCLQMSHTVQYSRSTVQ